MIITRQKLDPKSLILTGPDLHTVSMECYHCHGVTKVHDVQIIDAVADMYRQMYEDLKGRMNEAIRNSHMIHGDDPMRQDFVAALIKIRESL
jgi:hypothetical protein